MSKDKKLVDEYVEAIRRLSKENAMNNYHSPFKVSMSNSDIKKSTGRKRLQKAVKNKIINLLKKEGIKASYENNSGIEIECSPLLEEKESYTLEDIKEKESVLKALRSQKNYDETKEAIQSGDALLYQN
jgi:hypothetical protein